MSNYYWGHFRKIRVSEICGYEMLPQKENHLCVCARVRARAVWGGWARAPAQWQRFVCDWAPLYTSQKKMRGKTVVRMRVVRLRSATERRFTGALRALDKDTTCSFETRTSYVTLESKFHLIRNSLWVFEIQFDYKTWALNQQRVAQRRLR